ncbi:unnamed protein product [Prunus armeniaca]|uniref:Uncharacterized protein n=1 Tax=Prunus armeniaca TaxID=36596 RepID=A0A6J5W5S4_PRUAR|nr:unnamed protein product [Prunus armeniaca]
MSHPERETWDCPGGEEGPGIPPRCWTGDICLSLAVMFLLVGDLSELNGHGGDTAYGLAPNLIDKTPKEYVKFS